MRIGTIIALVAAFAVIAMGIEQIGNLNDTLTITGGIDVFFDRLTLLYLLVGGFVLIGSVVSFVVWAAKR